MALWQSVPAGGRVTWRRGRLPGEVSPAVRGPHPCAQETAFEQFRARFEVYLEPDTAGDERRVAEDTNLFLEPLDRAVYEFAGRKRLQIGGLVVNYSVRVGVYGVVRKDIAKGCNIVRQHGLVASILKPDQFRFGRRLVDHDRLSFALLKT